MAKRSNRGFCIDLLFPIVGILLSLLNGVQSEALNVSNCNAYVTRTNGVVCYSTIAFTDSWEVAQKVCQSRGETLIEILTQEENDAVRNLLVNNNIVDSWIGATQSNATWRWLDGVEISDQGCFVDDLQNPDMEFVANFASENTIDKCLSYCSSQYYIYAGVEAGELCRCGMQFGRYGQKDSSCGSLCPGNNSQTCGGVSSQQIFVVYGAYSNWLRGQPSNNDEYQTCATIDSATGYQWQDVYCRDPYKALCELRPLNNSCRLANSRSFPINGRCFLPTETETNFFQSRYVCRSYGGDLLTYLSAEDTALLARALNHSVSVQYYIGLTKWAWKWQTENEFLYTNWRLSNPTGPGFDCITIKRDASPGEWMTTNCNSTHLYICQKSNATLHVTAPLFTVPPSTTSRRTPPPPLSRTSITRSPAGSSTLASLYPTKPSTANHISSSSSSNNAAIIGGAVAGGVGFIILVVVIITICVVICQRNRDSKTNPSETDATSDASKVDPLPPTYFFGIETTPKYRNEKPVYPALPDFGEGKTVKNTTLGRNKSLSTSSSSSSDVLPAYMNLTLIPTKGSTNGPTPYSADIFINPELSY